MSTSVVHLSHKPHGRGLWGWEKDPTVPMIVGHVGMWCGIQIMPSSELVYCLVLCSIHEVRRNNQDSRLAYISKQYICFQDFGCYLFMNHADQCTIVNRIGKC